MRKHNDNESGKYVTSLQFASQTFSECREHEAHYNPAKERKGDSESERVDYHAAKNRIAKPRDKKS